MPYPDQPKFERPFRVVGYCVVDANGKVVAQGSPELCRRVLAEGPISVEREGGQ